MAEAPAQLRGLQWTVLVLALLGIAASIAGAVVDLHELSRAYLVAVVNWSPGT